VTGENVTDYGMSNSE